MMALKRGMWTGIQEEEEKKAQEPEEVDDAQDEENQVTLIVYNVHAHQFIF